jgi:(2Fe-2S) ferredoxin
MTSTHPSKDSMRYRHHLFICENRRPDGAPKGSCAARGGEAVRQAFKDELRKRGLTEEIRANGAGCLDLCGQGPVVVVYPEGTWYAPVKPEDVAEIVEEHLVGGAPVARLLAKNVS